MNVRPARPEDWAYIVEARHQVNAAIGGDPNSSWEQPLVHGIHLIATQGVHRIGMAEGYLYRQMFRSLAESPFAPLTRLQDYEFTTLCSMRSIWVDPGARHGPAFAYLVMMMAECGARVHGMTHATVATVHHHPAIPMYRALGGKQIGRVTLAAFRDELIVLVFDLSAMLRSSLYDRARIEQEGR